MRALLLASALALLVGPAGAQDWPPAKQPVTEVAPAVPEPLVPPAPAALPQPLAEPPAEPLPVASPEPEPPPGPTWVEVGGLFADRCVKCHSGAAAPNGLSLDGYPWALSGAWTHSVLIAGDPDGSPLILRARGEMKPRMPLDGPPFLSDDEIAMISEWILKGMPEGEAGAVPPAPVRLRPAPGEPVTFADIELILQRNCIECHSVNSRLNAPPAGLRLDSLARVLAGGERIVVVPGNPGLSALWRHVEGLAEPRMPKDGPPWLDPEDIRLIHDWIEQGAPDAEGAGALIPTGGEVRLRGMLTAQGEIDGAAFDFNVFTRIDKLPRVGQPAEMRGTVTPEGGVLATRYRAR